MVRISYTRVGFALGMYISCCLCQFPSHWLPNANPVFGGIRALCFLTSKMTFNMNDLPFVGPRYKAGGSVLQVSHDLFSLLVLTVDDQHLVRV